MENLAALRELLLTLSSKLAAVAMACYRFEGSKYVESVFFSGREGASHKVSGDALRWLMLLFQAGRSVVRRKDLSGQPDQDRRTNMN